MLETRGSSNAPKFDLEDFSRFFSLFRFSALRLEVKYLKFIPFVACRYACNIGRIFVIAQRSMIWVLDITDHYLSIERASSRRHFLYVLLREYLARYIAKAGQLEYNKVSSSESVWAASIVSWIGLRLALFSSPSLSIANTVQSIRFCKITQKNIYVKIELHSQTVFKIS